MVTRRGLLKTLGGLLLSGIATGSYAVGFEPMGRLRIANYRIRPANWPDGLRLRIVALADIHACKPWMTTSRIDGIVARANALSGDMIVLLGDFTSSMRGAVGTVTAPEWAKCLQALKAPLGVHAVLGNHDWWEDPDAQAAGGGETVAHRALRDVGIDVYSNRAARFEKDGRGFWIAGLEDQVALRPSSQWQRASFQGLDDLHGTLAQVEDDDPVVLLAHEPDIFPQVPSRVSVTLSGHTHGGQVRIFGYAPVVPSRYGNRYVYGHVQEEGRDIVISGGLGCSIAPVRFGSPPEITIIELGYPPAPSA
ncbi:metallophosphoesterase [Sinorhizobium sp. BG8]|uniref:metallophosphoesterase n=1 Tax=Sinorhizobium sp. BG8 TaxID=2613773 RepID=UPI00193D39A8|nr:metallophosphoesterase [Sinorhizobium sp. BG8]QRM56595.1 metallophosphoesterase [Sinorhizobium sp. BG8]